MKQLARLLIGSLMLCGCATLMPRLENDPYESQCESGQALSCHCAAWDALNLRLTPGPTQSVDYQPTGDDRQALAENFFSKACKLGDQSGCQKKIRVCVFDTMPISEKCSRGDTASCNQKSIKSQAEEKLSRKQFWEGSGPNKILNTRIEPRFLYLQYFFLSQLADGYAVFQWNGPIQVGSFPPISIQRQSFHSTKLNPGVGLPTVAPCMKYIKDIEWEDDHGFPMTVKSYAVVKCES
jgi:hypothetical protein